MEPCVCGRSPDAGDHFCAGCGLRLARTPVVGSAVPGPTIDDSLGDDLLIDGSGGGSPTDTTVRTDSQLSSPSQLRWVLAGVVALGVLMLGLARWPTSDPAQQVGEDAAAPESAADGDSPGDGTPSPASREETAEAELIEPDDSDQVDDEAGVGTPGSAESDETGPLLGERTGLGLVIARSFGKREILDLDTGETFKLAISGVPTAVVGSTLVLQSRANTVQLVDLSNPEADGVALPHSPNGQLEFIAVENGLVWAADHGPEDGGMPVLQGFNTAGMKVDEMDLDQLWPFSFFRGGDISTDLVQVLAGGIYRRNGSDFERVAQGELLASSDNLALVRQCDERRRCETSWYARPNWEAPIDLPVPSSIGATGFNIAGDGKWLIRFDVDGGRTELTDIATGRTVHRSSEPVRFGLGGFTFSPDGRWLVERTGSRRTTVVDLLNEVTLDLDLGSGLDDTPLIFVDMADTAFG